MNNSVLDTFKKWGDSFPPPPHTHTHIVSLDYYLEDIMSTEQIIEYIL
jgi:hypothetical protein